MDINRLVKNGNYFYFKDSPKHATGVSLNKTEVALSTVGQTEQLVATVTPADAVDKTVTWSSSDTSIATVDSTGLVTCVSVGSCTITATTNDGGYTATAQVADYFPTKVDFLLIGGGGAGGNCGGGGGGAGGFIQCLDYCIEIGSYPVVIGAGGKIAYPRYNGCPGCSSTFNGITAYGGGGGIGRSCSTAPDSSNGASGGGAYYYCNSIYGSAIYGTQGCNGGCGYKAGCHSGGGGGFLSVGGNGSSWACRGGTGGSGGGSGMSGARCYYAGGGGGGTCNGGSGAKGGCGSDGGGNGAGPFCSDYTITNATTYGSGGGGTTNPGNGDYGKGCQGVFILRYPTSSGYNITGGTCYTCGDYTIHCFTSNGTLTVN